jgi:hypothetical protein
MADNDRGISASAVTASIMALLISVFFFFDGVQKIQHHSVSGWLICGACALTFALHFYRLAKFEISAHKKSRT